MSVFEARKTLLPKGVAEHAKHESTDSGPRWIARNRDPRSRKHGCEFATGFLNQAVASLFSVGWIGVDLFFVLSGFLITGILLDTKGSRSFLKTFWVRRALRILPLYFGFLSVFAIIAYAKYRIRGGDHISKETLISLFAYYYNFYAAFTKFPTHIHHFWSLCVEEHFYLVWPFVIMALTPRGGDQGVRLRNSRVIPVAVSFYCYLAGRRGAVADAVPTRRAAFGGAHWQ